MKTVLVITLIASFFIFSCTNNTLRDPGSVDGFEPKYVAVNTAGTISTQGPTATINAGKIYAYSNYIFQNDLYSGFHVIDNSNPAAAKKIAFINVPSSTEIAIKGSFLYSNCLGDLVVLDIRDPRNPVLVKRVKDVFPVIDQTFPPASGYFECPDKNKGLVVGWELKRMAQPKCRR